MDYKKSKAPVNTVTRNIMISVMRLEPFMRVLQSLASAQIRFLWKSNRT